MKRAIFIVASIDLAAMILGFSFPALVGYDNYGDDNSFRLFIAITFLLAGILNLIIGIPVLLIGLIFRSAAKTSGQALLICGGCLMLISIPFMWGVHIGR